MTRFAHLLQKIGERLDVAEPTRTRILLEVAADLEDTYQHHLDHGLAPHEAERRAAEAFGASEETLGLLARIHRGSIASVGDRMSQQLGTTWAKILLILLLLFEVLAAGRILTDPWFIVRPSPFLWPIAAIALATFLVTIWKLLQILPREGTDARSLRNGVSIPLFLAAASLAVAFTGFLFHLQRFFRLGAERAPESLFMDFAGWMVAISSLMNVGLLVALFGGLAWFILSGLAARAEARRMESLLRSAA
jgi:hypothetical protein